MDKKKRQLYIAVSFFLIIFVFSLIWGAVLLLNFQFSFWGAVGIEILGGICGALGFGSLLKPDKIGKFAVSLFSKLMTNYEDSRTGSQQTQTKNSGNQVMISGSKNIIHVDSDKTIENGKLDEKIFGTGKVFSCPNGHRIEVYPPDDNHPIASIEKEYAEKQAEGTVIERFYDCQRAGCDIRFSLYWYQKKIQVSHGRVSFI
jgi:hypothetical protein